MPQQVVALGRWRWPALGVLRGRRRRSSSSSRPACSSTGRPRDRERARARRAVGEAAATRCSRPGSRPASPCSRRCRSPSSRCATRRGLAPLERLSYAANALPGIVIALSLVFFARALRGARLPDARAARLRVRRPLLPAGARRRRVGARGASARGSRRPPRASGAARCGRCAAVTVPLVRSGVLAGAALVFLSRDEGASGDASAAADRLRDARDGDLEVHPARRVLAALALAGARCS